MKRFELEGAKLRVSVRRSGVFIDGARVTTADVDASNGVVHIIDQVLLPPAADSMAETFEAAPSIPPQLPIAILVAANPHLTTLLGALGTANLLETLASNKGPFTVFAPTNEAFAKLPAATLKSLLEPQNVGKLTSILTYHVVSGNVHAKDLRDGEMVTTLEGAKLRVSVRKNGVFIDGAKVLVADEDASNGVVHIIDQVLLPPAADEKQMNMLQNILAAVFGKQQLNQPKLRVPARA
jgi:uncharacterized surface protein with fasciclin (FAS1) repeats